MDVNSTTASPMAHARFGVSASGGNASKASQPANAEPIVSKAADPFHAAQDASESQQFPEDAVFATHGHSVGGFSGGFSGAGSASGSTTTSHGGDSSPFAEEGHRVSSFSGGFSGSHNPGKIKQG